MNDLAYVRGEVKDSIRDLLAALSDNDLRDMLQYVLCGENEEDWGSLSRGVLARLLAGESPDALVLACSVELSHHASLVVDDYIDKARVRRGCDTFWVKYGAEECILLAHLMVSLALEGYMKFDKLCGLNGCAQKYALEVIRDMARSELEASRSPLDSCAMYLRRARGKTGSLYGLVGRLASMVRTTRILDADRSISALCMVGDARQMLDDFVDARLEDGGCGLFITKESEIENRRRSIYSLQQFGYTLDDLRDMHKACSDKAVSDLADSIKDGRDKGLILEVCSQICWGEHRIQKVLDVLPLAG